MLSSFLEIAKKASLAAEEIILHYYNLPKDITIKEDKSPVSIADRKAEKIIIQTIRESFPNHNILGEETGNSNHSSEYTWILDPIDGTKNYLRGLPYFATQIALMKNDEFILGVSHAPLLHETLWAEIGKGAYKNNEQIYVSDVDSLPQAFMTFGGLKYFKKMNKEGAILRLSEDVMASRGYGDFLGYHFLAQGKTDFFLDFGCYIWDIAAVIPIIIEAGGKATDGQGNILNRNSRSIIASNGILQDRIVSYFK